MHGTWDSQPPDFLNLLEFAKLDAAETSAHSKQGQNCKFGSDIQYCSHDLVAYRLDKRHLSMGALSRLLQLRNVGSLFRVGFAR
jgi:hypothetical protein